VSFIYININQKKYNTKNTISQKNTINTFSVGSVIKYFNLKQGKSSRRSIKGTKIFLNFLKNIFGKKYKMFFKNNKTIYTINSFDYNLLFLKKFLKSLTIKNTYTLIKLGISFTKKQNPKKKSIKKRIIKNILLNFIKNNKQIMFG
jgi:hypothetical protein